MSNIQQYKKPELIVLEEKPKLTSYPMEQRLAVCTGIVKELLQFLGVGKNSDSDHHVKSIKFIAESCQFYSYEEILKAFNMYVAGRFQQEAYQQLNPVVIGYVMREFEFYKREQLKLYRQKESMKKDEPTEPTEAEKKKSIEDAITRTYLEFKNTGKVTGLITHIYNHLDLEGKFQGNKSDKDWARFKWKVYALCQKEHKSEQNYRIGVIIEDAKTMSKRKILIKYYKGK